MKRFNLKALLACAVTFVCGCATYTPYTKYTADVADAVDQPQYTWGALNCHDPKLFQDDDGTYYVYSTDASIGNAHKNGLQVRVSKDLVTWDTVDRPVIVNWDPDFMAWMNTTPKTATTWAPTVIKQDGKYYMFHGIIADGALSTGPTAWIGMAIADSPLGPFEPAQVYDPQTYKQSALVRYAWDRHTEPVVYKPTDSTFTAYIGGEMNAMTVSSISVNGGANVLSEPVKLVKGNWTDLNGPSYASVGNLTGSFTVTYRVILNDTGDNSWEKWSFVLYDQTTRGGWYLRADSYSNNATAIGAVTNLYGSDMGASVKYEPSDGLFAASQYRQGMALTITARYNYDDGSCLVIAEGDDKVLYKAKGTRFTSDTIFDTYNTSVFDTKFTEGGTQSSDKWAFGFGCIDPEFVIDMATNKIMTNKFGDYYMIYGSWKGGLALITVDSKTFKPTYVDSDGKHHVLDQALDTIPGAYGIRIAGGEGAAYEGAQLIYNSDTGYYYLFVSMGDLTFEYRVGMGRSKNIEGPYIDASGRNMSDVNFIAGDPNYYHNVGSKFLGAYQFDDQKGFRSQGGHSLLLNNEGKVLFANHARTQFYPSYFFFLQIHEVLFNDQGWPVINVNEYDPAAAQKNAPVTKDSIAGEYDAIITFRSPNVKAGSNFPDVTTGVQFSESDGFVTPSQKIYLNKDNTVSGAYTGKWSIQSSDKYKDAVKISFDLDNIGKFDGFALWTTDFSRLDQTPRMTITFNTICEQADAPKAGEYFFGNLRNYK